MAHLTKAQVVELKNNLWWSALKIDALTGAKASLINLFTAGTATGYYIYNLEKNHNYSVTQQNRRFIARQLREALKSNKPLMFVSQNGRSDLLQDYLNKLKIEEQNLDMFSIYQGERP